MSVRIGGAAGYWGDSTQAPRQLVEKGNVDYLVFDYLAEVTMSILVRAKAADPTKGYAADFVHLVMKPLLPQIKEKGIKVVVNAGGVNIAACADALRKVAADQGIALKVGIVEGDDLLGRMDDLRSRDIREMFSGAPLPDELSSANAYLGAFPIAAALDGGAEVVITGRCVDSAVTLGILIHEFGWSADAYDQLAAGTLAGHILECGAQATGGNVTDWQDSADGWDNMGYPIAECFADGRFVISKPAGTGGIVSRLSVGEQILYETGDTQSYIVPDVICDFSQAVLDQSAPDEVTITDVKGRAPTDTFKVSATYRDGYRATALTLVTGFEAVEKARHYGDALLKRVTRLLGERGMDGFDRTAVHVIGAETLWGANASPHAAQAREVVVQTDVRHQDKAAIEVFSKETTGVALSMTTGRCGVGEAGRPKATPVVAQFAFLLDKSDVVPVVSVDGQALGFTPPQQTYSPAPALSPPPQSEPFEGPTTTCQLIDIAVARSGDKGNSANVGVMARKPEFYDVICREVTAEKVAAWFAHVTKGEVSCFAAPGMGAVNFLLRETLDGGGTSSLHLDKLAKTYGQQILAMPVEVPSALLHGGKA
ncbi:DUF1446 domain-containing protein [Sulfitobacter sp. F26169L]|uniref:acyclic terpene utilization AtuA family protein n=1 Tax=Sulfitobacter sp. F26169L TaxID=2996015 RepID=UPI002260EDB0|nr:acyclic terpene utilization AtuA family protein [Sulfitobacter sp. F26169L]MCX7568104.1 DUF1446 domain-containing protein [Sulfitobacter sp. F26169L]